MGILPAEPDEADFQRVGDAADLRQPLLTRIAREVLGVRTPWPNQRLWEFATAYAALDRLGALAKDKVGVSFAAGKETLLYAVTRRVRTLHATDLYEPGSMWGEARTDDPTAFVLGAATIPFDREALKVRRMDMRQADFPDRSLDFAYSISSIEHIGQDADFVTHLREARRVLKEDGVYVLTTTFVHAPETIRQPWCHMFAAGHLEQLVAEAGLVAQDSLDATLSDDPDNRPWFKPGVFVAPPTVDAHTANMWLRYGSTAFGACCLVLRPRGERRPWRVVGSDAARARLDLLQTQTDVLLWSRPTEVATRVYENFLSIYPEYFVFTETFHFGPGALTCTLAVESAELPFRGALVYFLRAYPTWASSDVTVHAEQRLEVKLPESGVFRHTFTFATAAELCYSLLVRREGPDVPLTPRVTFQHTRT